MEWRNLIVQLFAPTSDDGKSGRIETGHPVAKDLILTAAHVVGDCLGSEVEARWWHSENDDDRKLVQCQEIAWDGRKQQIAPFDQSTPCDVVLLRCPFPESLAGQWGTVASIRPQDHVPFASSGFAFDGDRGKTPKTKRGRSSLISAVTVVSIG